MSVTMATGYAANELIFGVLFDMHLTNIHPKFGYDKINITRDMAQGHFRPEVTLNTGPLREDAQKYVKTPWHVTI